MDHWIGKMFLNKSEHIHGMTDTRRQQTTIIFQPFELNVYEISGLDLAN